MRGNYDYIVLPEAEKKKPEKGGMYEGKKKGRNKESERGKYEEKGTKGWDGWDGCQYGRKWTKGYFDKSALMIGAKTILEEPISIPKILTKIGLSI